MVIKYLVYNCKSDKSFYNPANILSVYISQNENKRIDTKYHKSTQMIEKSDRFIN